MYAYAVGEEKVRWLTVLNSVEAFTFLISHRMMHSTTGGGKVKSMIEILVDHLIRKEDFCRAVHS